MYTEVRRKDCGIANLVECRCKDGHKETVVDVTNQLVSDIGVGHLGTANVVSVEPFITCGNIF